jgi:hypothetical protein
MEAPDHSVPVDEDGRRNGRVLTVFSSSDVEYRDRVDQLVAMIRHDGQVRKIPLDLLGVIQAIGRNGDDASAALGEFVVVRFELT